MGIRSRIEDRATQLQSDLAAQAQMRYIQWLMKEEECDYEMAMAIVMGNTDPLEPEYMLGFKLADPAPSMMRAAIKVQPSTPSWPLAETLLSSITQTHKGR